MDSGFSNDPHSERGYACPKNTYGIQLQDIEKVFTQRRLTQLEEMGITGVFDLDHIRAIHRFVFRDVFACMFGPAMHIAGALEDTWRRLISERLLIDLAPKEFAATAAYSLGEINAIHPFREGNGRTQREFIRQLALRAEQPLSWAGFTQEEMVDASILSHMRGDHSSLSAIIDRALNSSRTS